MIAFLTGRLLEKRPNRLIVDVGGVGYDVQVPLSTFYRVPEPGGDVSLRIHTHVREEAIALFGFQTALELHLFERLISISGVGPRLALAVLSGIEPAELVRAVRVEDVGRLTRIPGIGKKTAERISLELKHRLPPTLQVEEGEEKPEAPEDRLRHDLVSALVNLGYPRGPAEKAIDSVVKRGEARAFEQALKDALKALTG